MLKKIVKFIIDPRFRIAVLASRGYLNKTSDCKYLKLRFYERMGKKLNLENPQTFSEKLQWLKLYDRKPIYTTMVDKHAVKEYVAERIGEDYIIPTLGVWDNFDEIDFDALPERFVLKCTHDSGGLVICRDKDKLDKEAAKAKLNKSLKQNFYYHTREWPYKNVKPRVIAEQYMADSTKNQDLLDYKFMCFNGEVKCSFVCSDRFSEKELHVTFFDREWRIMPFERKYPRRREGFPKPLNYNKMLKLAEKLSVGIPFLRVDFYEVDGKIYFGELTFFPGSGMEKFSPEEWDYTLGSWIQLPEKTC